MGRGVDKGAASQVTSRCAVDAAADRNYDGPVIEMRITNEHCSFCDADLRGAEIPEESRQHYGDKTHFSRIIAIETDGYDGTSILACPDCNKQISRWTGEELTGPLDL